MAGSVNKVILVGNLGNDPEVRNLPSGGKVVNLSVATSDQWRDKNTGERKERTEWHTVVVFNEGLATVAEKYLKKGAKVYVEGQLSTRKWQGSDGQDRYTTEVVLQKFRGALEMLDKLPSNRPPGADSPEDYGTQSSRGGVGQGKPSTQPSRGVQDLDDDIPF